jgi:membrane-bound lytic murein transglycosylase D
MTDRTMLRPGARIRLALAFALVAAGSLASGAMAETFPMPASIAPRADFWTRVYSEVGTNGGLIHDSEQLWIVYEVVSLPEGTSKGRLDRHTKGRKEHYKAVLRTLATGKRSGLSKDESRVLALFPKGVSNGALSTASNRIRFQLGQRNKFIDGVRRMGRWEDYITRSLRQRGVPEDLVALPHVESSYNPDAHSHAGASGLWQFTRGTGRMFMRVDHVVDERRDPWIATVSAARLLKSNHDKLKTWPLAITAYNHGTGGMGRAVRQLGTRDIGRIVDRYKSPSFGFASRNFYSEFLAARRIDQNPDKYFGKIRKDAPHDPEIVTLDHYYKVATLSRQLEIPIAALRAENLALLSPVWSGQKFAPKGYTLRLPRRADKPVAKVMLASTPAGERFGEQTVDHRYRVQRGDTLSRIARRFRVRESEIVAVNNLRNRHFLRAGQLLEIPTQGGRVASASSAAPEPVPADGLYRVRSGDNLDAIAARFGVDRKDLQETNRIRNANQIRVGQVLEIPGGARSASPGHSGVYTVASGDTLDAIARRFRVSQQEIADLNGLRSRNRIQVGQTLHIPGHGVAEAAAKPQQAAAKPQQAAAAPVPAAAPEPDPTTAASATEPEPAPTAAPAGVSPAQPPAKAASAPSAPASPGSGALPLAPERYSVDGGESIVVQPEETLGHYAEWLGTSASSLRGTNGLQAGRALPLGERVRLDFSQVSAAEFQRRRLDHHRKIQTRFFATYEVAGTREHVVRKGETLWKLSRSDESIPVWLLHDYNPELNLAQLRPGQRLKIPTVRRRG